MTISNSTNVLYITYDGLTDQLGQSQVLPYLIGLSKKYSITVISSEKPIQFKKFNTRISEVCQTNNIVWLPVFYYASASGWTALLNYFLLKRKVFRQINNYNYTFIHCRSYFPALIALKIMNKFNIPFIFDMRGFWADERVDGKIWNIDKSLYKSVYQYFKRKEKILFASARQVVSLTQKAVPIIRSISGLNQTNIIVIPCAVDFLRFNPNIYTDRTIVRSDLEIRPLDTVLCYLGSTGTWYMLNEMLGFFTQLLKNRPDSIFLIITNDRQDQLIDRIAVTDVPPSRIRITAADPVDVPKYLSAADFAISFIHNAFSKQASSPTKLGEFLAMGLPVVCNDIGDVKTQVNITGGGIVLENFTKEDYADSVNKLLNTNFNRQEIRKKAMEIFDLETAIHTYDSIYYKMK